MLEIQKFIEKVNDNQNLSIENYSQLHEWSVQNIDKFWEICAQHVNIKFKQEPTKVIEYGDHFIDTKWFTGSKLNFTENMLQKATNDLAIIELTETERSTLTYNQLIKKVSEMEQLLTNNGIKKGDCVAAILPNHKEALIAFLACASIGAVWSSCTSEFGTNTIYSRLIQINPKCILFKPSASYGGKVFDYSEKLISVVNRLKSVDFTINLDANINKKLFDHQLNISEQHFSPKPLILEAMNFQDPLAILFSSGTTGKPKCIVHSVGGTLIQHLKELKLHCNLNEDSTFGYYTNCGWMMWNWMLSSLSLGLKLVLFDGSCFYPSKDSLWKKVAEEKINVFGTSAAFLSASEKLKITPNTQYSFEHLNSILSTGSPLLVNNFQYIRDHINPSTQVYSISGGTDIISCFVLGNPSESVNEGFIQCKGLGMDVKSFDDNGNEILNQKGELVCKQPFPSMPIYFLNDENNEKYKSSYFDRFNNIWCHGDYIIDNPKKGLQILGRSDTTLNPKGVRIGSAEIYEVVEKIPEISDSLVIGHQIKSNEEIVLFVSLNKNKNLDSDLIKTIKNNLKTTASPRHVPYKIFEVDDIPYTFSGKKVEKIIKEIFSGSEVKNLESLKNPKALDKFKLIAENLNQN